MSMDYPSNSNHGGKADKTEKNVQRVTSGDAVRRKKPLGRRITETFSQADIGMVWNFVVMDVVVPAAKDMLSEAVSQGIDQILFGGEPRFGGARRRAPGGGNSYTSYNRMSTGQLNYGRRENPMPPAMSRRGRATHNFDEILIPSRAEAEEVIDRLFDLINRFELATVSDLYDLVGITPNFQDQKWGWTNIQGANVVRTKGGYLLDLPRPEQIN